MPPIEIRPTSKQVPEITETAPLFPETMGFVDTTTRALFALLGISLPPVERQHYATIRFWLFAAVTTVCVFFSVWAVVWMMARVV